MDLRKVKELEETKKKYLKFRDIIILILIIIFIVYSILILYKYFMIKKIWKANVGTDLGGNYKITIYRDEDEKPDEYVYYRDGIKKYISENDEGQMHTFEIVTKNKIYFINDETKTYFTINAEDNNYYPEKINMFNYTGIFEDDEESKFSIIDVIKDNTTKISKEGYDGKEYIVFEQNNNKMYLNLDTYIAEVIKRTYSGGNTLLRMKTEIGAVTEKLELPDLEGYTDTTDLEELE